MYSTIPPELLGLQDYKKIMGMSQEEWNKLMGGKANLCVCKNCPTYNAAIEASIKHYRSMGDTAPDNRSLHEQALGTYFCYYDKSGRIRDDKGCICKSCPVGKQAKLVNSFYCIRGGETRQRGMRDPFGEILGIA
jgi:hypothetical protein